jgi:hypothetical protein
VIYQKREEAVAAAKAKAASEKRTVRIVRNNHGWALEGDSLIPSRTIPTSTEFINRLGLYDPPAPPPLRQVEPTPSEREKPPEGVDLNEAIALLDWITNGMIALSKMNYRLESQSYTNFAKSNAVEVFVPAIEKLHGGIGDNLSEKCLGFALESLRRLFLMKNRTSVQVELEAVTSKLSTVHKRTKIMKQKHLKTNCGIIWNASFPKGTISLETWQKQENSNIYRRSYTGQKSTFLSKDDWTEI